MVTSGNIQIAFGDNAGKMLQPSCVVGCFTIFGHTVLISLLCRPVLQESPGRGERVCGGIGQPGVVPWLFTAAAGLFQGHLGLPVLSGHRQLPILLT